MGNDTSDVYEGQKNESEDKRLTVGARAQKNESRKVSRCKYPFENSTIFSLPRYSLITPAGIR